MRTLSKTLITLLTTATLLSGCTNTPAKATIDPAIDIEFRNAANWSKYNFINVKQTNEGINLNGIYAIETDFESGGYVAEIKDKDINYRSYTIEIKFKANDFNNSAFNNNHSCILVGGPACRWFALSVNKNNELCATFDNSHTIRIKNAVIKAGKWTNIIVSISRDQGTLTVYINGEKKDTSAITLKSTYYAPNTSLDEFDKIWMFTNYSTGACFHGTIRRFKTYNRALSDQECSTLFEKQSNQLH